MRADQLFVSLGYLGLRLVRITGRSNGHAHADTNNGSRRSDSNLWPNARTHADLEPNPDDRITPKSHTDTNVDTHTNVGSHSNPDANPHADDHFNANTDTDTDENTHADSDAITNGDANSHAHTDGDTHPHTDACACLGQADWRSR